LDRVRRTAVPTLPMLPMALGKAWDDLE
jgi:hypothetical protein